MNHLEKYESLKSLIKKIGKIAVAYSGGVDSSLLLKASYDALGTNVIAITAVSEIHTDKEIKEASALTKKLGIPHILLPINVLENNDFCSNTQDRCYFCKNLIFGEFLKKANELGYSNLAEGSNLDDDNDFRPGFKAVLEMGVHSPLKSAGLRKTDIRYIAREQGLSAWDKASAPCLATRIPYGNDISLDKLNMVGQAEELMGSLGFKQFRVRHFGDFAKVEVLPEDFSWFSDFQKSEMLFKQFESIGFKNVYLDLKGYRTGSMNELL